MDRSQHRGGPLGWGIVGFGWVARDHAAPAMVAAGHVVRAVCDPMPAARLSARNRLDPAGGVHETLTPLLTDPGVEAIYVATPNHLHRDAVQAIAAAGKPILCEKPMAASLDDAEAMAATVGRSRIIYGTAFDQRHHPAHAVMRDALGDGLIGTPTAIRIVYACWLDAGWSITGEGDNWRADPSRAGGGALMDLAPHGLDLVEFLLGEPVEEIAALTQRRVQSYAVDDGALIIGRTVSGVLAQLHVAYNCPDALPRRRLEVLGGTGQLLADNTMGQDAGGSITWINAAGVARALNFEGAAESPFTRQMSAFAHAVRTGDSAGFNIARDLHTMRLLHRAYAGDPSCR
ncbi:Gfo/Idh/MocA family protein [Teichococcus vastitatis]|uniref:Gfo/Idh/MocA family oxidoreductase n=1 Tax=Teichococcus vastitatis TaxID=2307076 RepID=A0ABS9WCW6_9PROT|nr:Gfo/Idh/MocA family oxidoreductase [Pseudoroseomonas vastitatis]MCI0757160.1 Gfo/Idh/MocA family oxidoreductase [Pseudoroseomonas vastitatis]